MTAKEFYDKYIGKAVDIDGAYEAQCVDLFKAFTKDNYNIYNYDCTNGYASGLWIYRKDKPYYPYFEEVDINDLQDGDWCFWDKGSKPCPDSHVAMYFAGKFFGQNQGGQKKATLINISKNGMLGALRPKMYIKENPKGYKIRYQAHVADFGWLKEVGDGELAGTTGQGRRMEAIKINHYKDVYAKAHIETLGWIDYGKINKDTIIGTVGEAKRLEDLCLKGEFRYRVHIAENGWTPWTKADGIATLGTVGQALQLEAIEIEEL